MSTATAFWNWLAPRYARQEIADEAAYEKKLAMTQARFAPEMRIVEFGCGTGSTAVRHAPHVRAYVGIDVAERMIAIAREKAELAGARHLDFVVGTLEGSGFEDASFDAALGLNILHLVPDLDETLASVARLVRPRGFFGSSTVCLDDVEGPFGRIGRLMRWIPFLPTVTSMTVEDLIAKIEDAGFEIEERFEQAPGVVFLIARRR